MPPMKTVKRYIFLALCIATFFAFEVAAHPQDDFCGDIAMDPLLCSELAALDSGESIHENTVDIQRGVFDTLLLYVRLGVEHILPDGVDHLLFILALLLSQASLGRLLLQISVFTIAHSVTLILAALSLISFPSHLVEILIALSIAVVSLENIVFKKVVSWRLWLIFVFGLLHGLGFAGALQETGLSSTNLVWSLLGFNIGVELAQLLFAVCVFSLIFPFMKKAWYRRYLSILISAAISFVALWWVVERALL